MDDIDISFTDDVRKRVHKLADVRTSTRHSSGRAIFRLCFFAWEVQGCWTVAAQTRPHEAATGPGADVRLVLSFVRAAAHRGRRRFHV